MSSTKKSFLPLFKRSKSSDDIKRRATSLPRLIRTPTFSNMKSNKKFCTPHTLGTTRAKLKLDYNTPSSCISASTSPLQQKQQYTHLNEKSHLPRIKQFVAMNDPAIEISRPPTTSQFIAVTQLLLSHLCGSAQPPITLKNYKATLPSRMKELDYTINISQTFLKCPNTIQNFNQVLSIWIYLLDLVENASEGVQTLNCVNYAHFMFVHEQNNFRQEDLKTEFVATLYKSNNTTKEKEHNEINKLRNELETLQMEVQDWEYVYDKDKNHYYGKGKHLNLDEKISKCISIIESDKKVTVKKEIDRLEKEVAFKQERRDKFLDGEHQEKLLKMEELMEAIASFEISENDVHDVTLELERKQRQLRLLTSREHEFNERVREVKLHNDKQIAAAEEIIFEYNTKLLLNTAIPEDIKNALYLDEKNVKFEQISQVAAKLRELQATTVKDSRDVDAQIRDLQSRLSAMQHELQMNEEARKKVENKLSEATASCRDLQQIASMSNQIYQNDIEKTKVLKDLFTENIDKYNRSMLLYKDRKEEIESCLSEMKAAGLANKELTKAKILKHLNQELNLLTASKEVENTMIKNLQFYTGDKKA